MAAQPNRNSRFLAVSFGGLLSDDALDTRH
jgi:hypothetical protein